MGQNSIAADGYCTAGPPSVADNLMRQNKCDAARPCCYRYLPATSDVASVRTMPRASGLIQLLTTLVFHR